MDVWPDAYSAYYPSDGYVTVSFRESLVEPLSDYHGARLDRWMDLQFDYIRLMCEVRKMTGLDDGTRYKIVFRDK